MRPKWFHRLRGLAAGALLTAGLPGCAQARPAFFRPASQRLVWPPPPERPRVEFVGEFAGPLHARQSPSPGATLRKIVFGSEEQVPHIVTPHAVAVDATGDRVAIADPNAQCVHVLGLAAESYQRVVAADPSGRILRCPIGVAWLGNLLFIADAEARGIAVTEPAQPVSKKWTIPPARWFGTEELVRPSGLAVDPATGRVYVADSRAHAIFVFDMAGQLLTRFGSRGSGPGQFNFPSHVAIDGAGNLVVSDSMNFRVQRFRPDGKLLSTFGRKGDAAGDFALPKGVAVDLSNNIWVVDAQFENVQAFNENGDLMMSFGEEGSGPGEFWLPAGVTTDSRQRLWVADTYNRRVQVFSLQP